MHIYIWEIEGDYDFILGNATKREKTHEEKDIPMK